MATELRSQGTEELQRFAREHHVSYGVDEEAPAARQQGRGTFDVTLFATHGEDRLEGPSCPRCAEVTQALRSLAESVVESADAASCADILEPAPVLYVSKDSHGPDEVSLVVRVLETDRREERVPTPSHLRRIEERLKALGVAHR